MSLVRLIKVFRAHECAQDSCIPHLRTAMAARGTWKGGPNIILLKILIRFIDLDDGIGSMERRHLDLSIKYFWASNNIRSHESSS